MLLPFFFFFFFFDRIVTNHLLLLTMNQLPVKLRSQVMMTAMLQQP